MSWGYITNLLEQIDCHSTYLGKLWFLAFIVFRIVLTGVAGESIYYDEQGHFTCNTRQPGCGNVCYDLYAPLSHVRFWIFHIMMVAVPTILYLAFALHRISRSASANRQDIGQRPKHLEKEEDIGETALHEQVELEMLYTITNQGAVNDAGKHDGRRYIKRDGLMGAYLLQLVVRTIFETAFLVGQYLNYGLVIPVLFKCVRKPCPNKVDCFVSRPTEKTIFLWVMYAVGGLCLLISIVEMLHLANGEVTDMIRVRRARDGLALFRQNRNHGVSEAPVELSYPPAYTSVAHPPVMPGDGTANGQLCGYAGQGDGVGPNPLDDQVNPPPLQQIPEAALITPSVQDVTSPWQQDTSKRIQELLQSSRKCYV
uniref:gap junction gamma-2 protein-like n=1 Tax=Myxine glutinosa TaxID=7769 RepID=UPI00358EE7DD